MDGGGVMNVSACEMCLIFFTSVAGERLLGLP